MHIDNNPPIRSQTGRTVVCHLTDPMNLLPCGILRYHHGMLAALSGNHPACPCIRTGFGHRPPTETQPVTVKVIRSRSIERDTLSGTTVKMQGIQSVLSVYHHYRIAVSRPPLRPIHTGCKVIEYGRIKVFLILLRMRLHRLAMVRVTARLAVGSHTLLKISSPTHIAGLFGTAQSVRQHIEKRGSIPLPPPTCSSDKCVQDARAPVCGWHIPATCCCPDCFATARHFHPI